MNSRILKLETEQDHEEAIAVAVEILEAGGLVVYPTDTSYGLACDPRNQAAVWKLFDAKQRERNIAVPLLFADIKQCEEYHEFIDLEKVVVRLFWPGVLTLIVKAKENVPSYVTGGRTTVAIRVPNHPIPRGIAKKLGAPIVGTSANRAGGPSPYDVESAQDQLGDSVELYIDDGPSNEDNDSTIIGIKVGEDGFSSIKVFREGVISTEMLTNSLSDDTDALRFWTNRIFQAEM